METQGRRMDPERANPQGMTGTWEQVEGDKGGSNGREKRQHRQARIMGRRVKWRRMAGGRWGRSPGRRSFAPGEEVWIGCKR